MNKIVCPGSNNQTCADGYTCCMNTLGSYGCCPIKDAGNKRTLFYILRESKNQKNIFIFTVCCDDKVHCCPKDAVCDSKAGKCSTVSLKMYSPYYSCKLFIKNYSPILTCLLLVLYFAENVIIKISTLEKQECHLPRWRFSMS